LPIQDGFMSNNSLQIENPLGFCINPNIYQNIIWIYTKTQRVFDLE